MSVVDLLFLKSSTTEALLHLLPIFYARDELTSLPLNVETILSGFS